MLDDYNKARKAGLKNMNYMIRHDKDPYLTSLDKIINFNYAQSMINLGIMEIPLTRVVGTRHASRAASFSSNFMPIMDNNTEFSYKWSTLFDSQVEEGIREPVKVYEYLWNFYVEEGNKRVSVLKYMEVPSITAEVIRIQPTDDGSELIQAYHEFEKFFQASRSYLFVFKKPGQYQKLAEMLGMSLDESWPWDKMNQLSGAYYRFAKIYREETDEAMYSFCSDAFYIYLTLYDFDTLLDSSANVLKQRIRKLLPEFIVNLPGKQLVVKEEPPQQKKDDSVLSVLSSLIPDIIPKKKPLVVFLHRSNPEDSAWIASHHQGIEYVKENMKDMIDIEERFDLSDSLSIEKAIDEAADKKADVIFTTSANEINDTLKGSIKYPDIQFFNCSLNESHQSVSSYYAKLYGTKFLLGALAASLCENGKIGYLADYPIYGTLANINAFAIGAAFIKPEIKVYLKWSTVETYKWQEEFQKEDVHLISAHDLTKPSWGTNELGLYRHDANGNNETLAVPVVNWGMYYEMILLEVINRESPYLNAKDTVAVNYWYGISAGIADLILSDKLPYYSRKMLYLLRDTMIKETLNPFSGEMHSQKGLIQDINSPRLNNEQIINMDWLNDNIIGDIPDYDQFNEYTRSIIDVSGITIKR